MPRDYAHEYATYQGTPEQIKNRAKRNAARREMGLKKGDSRDVHHKIPLIQGGSNKKTNLSAVLKSWNRAQK